MCGIHLITVDRNRCAFVSYNLQLVSVTIPVDLSALLFVITASVCFTSTAVPAEMVQFSIIRLLFSLSALLVLDTTIPAVFSPVPKIVEFRKIIVLPPKDPFWDSVLAGSYSVGKLFKCGTDEYC